MIPLASFLLTIFVVFLFQKQVVDLLKTINPEKHGSIFDFNFNKKWIASCDEAQQLLIYKAAYKAFRIGIYTCLALWLLLFLANMAFDVGLLPIACVSLIWLIITIAYYVESRHLQAGTPSATL